MKNSLLPLCVICCILTSCNKEMGEEIIDDSQEPAKTYMFKSIDYRIEADDDGVKTVEFSNPVIRYTNNTSIAQIVPLDYISGIKNSSRFYDHSSEFYTITENNDSVEVCIPAKITDSKILYLTVDKWPYKNGLFQGETGIKGQDTIQVAPHQQLTVSCTYIMEEYSVTCYVTFVEQPFGREIVIKGRWSGSFLRNFIPALSFQ